MALSLLIVHLAYCFSWTISKEVGMNFDHEENQGYKQWDLDLCWYENLSTLKSKFQLWCHDFAQSRKESFNQKVWPSNAPHVFYVIRRFLSIIIFLNHFSIWEHVRFYTLDNLLKISLKKLRLFMAWQGKMLSIKSSNYDTSILRK